MIRQEDIDKIIEKVDIVEYLSDNDVPLKQKGAAYWGLCPVKAENTPSFEVSQAKGLCHCHGCGFGGTVIQLSMHLHNYTFSEAIKKDLAPRAGIQIKEKELTPEEETARKEKERMFILMSYVQTFFVEQMKLSLSTQEYVYNRWSKEYSDKFGIGYAPKDGQALVKYLQKYQFDLELAVKASVLTKSDKGGYYSYYANRCTIPQRDRYGNIIGYTARRMDGVNEVKYINPRTCAIYEKGKQLFGIDYAYAEAGRQGIVNIVEGAPDAMRLHIIGIENTVAFLGTAMTDIQLDMVKKMAPAVRFLPDADSIKKEGEFPPGTKAVLNNGEAALRAGLTVYVRAIPHDDDGAKQDPDEYFTSKEVFDALKDEEYIIWAAKTRLHFALTTAQEAEAIYKVGELMMLCDAVKRKLLVNQLVDITDIKKSVWNDALRQAQKQTREQEAKVNVTDNNFGLIFGDNEIQFPTDDENLLIATFGVTPKYFVKNDYSPKRIVELHNAMESALVEFSPEDLSPVNSFRRRLNNAGCTFCFHGNDGHLQRMLSFVGSHMKIVTEVSRLGWQEQEFFAYCNGAFDGTWHPADDDGIVDLGSKGLFYFPAASPIYRDNKKRYAFEKTFIHTDGNPVTLLQYATQMQIVYQQKAMVGFAFLFAAIFRDVVVRVAKMPILNLFGEKGTGKTEMGRFLTAFFFNDTVPPNINNTTISAMGERVQAIINGIVHFDEYKYGLAENKQEFLKGIWDGKGRTLRDMDGDRKTITTGVDTALIISGQQMPVQDVALLTRVIFLNFVKNDFTEEESNQYNTLEEMREKGLTHLTNQILCHRKEFESQFEDRFNEAQEMLNSELHEESITTRIQNNWVVLLAALKVMQNLVELPFSSEDLLPYCIDCIRTQNKIGNDSGEVAQFWQMVQALFMGNKIYQESEFKITVTSQVSIDKKYWRDKSKKESITFDHPTQILKINPLRIFSEYQEQCRRQGCDSIDQKSLEQYLMANEAFVIKKNTEKFRRRLNGLLQMEPDGKSPLYDHPQSLYFNYEILKARYDLNLDYAEHFEVERTPEPVQSELPF